jgi:glycosyltransferase involved in cell wall biosynthesis/SAM-dependent methyltransferase
MSKLRSGAALPRITVVTPNLNGGLTLRRTIESVVQQGYPNLEYIIVDGGSTDDSHRIMADFASQIDCVVIGRDRNLYDAVAKGFDLASGEVLAWLNSDDMYEPGVLHRVGTHFARHPKWAVIYFDGTVWHQGWRVPNRSQKFVGLFELLRGHVLYQDSVFFRRSAYEAVGGLQRTGLRLAGDYQLWLKLAERYRLHYVAESGSCFRKRPQQLSGDWAAYLGEMAQAREEFQQHLPRYFRLRSAPGVILRKIASRIRARRRRFVYELSNELQDWSPVREGPPQPLAACRCPVCGRQPDRLLFSTPDTRFGDRTVRSVYLCSRCETAILFPRPDESELAALYERTYSGDIPPLGDPPPDVYSPYQRPSLLRATAWYRWLGRKPGLLRLLRVPWNDIVALDEARDAPILEIGCFEGRVLDRLREQGYTNLYGTDFNTPACQVAASRGHRVHAGDITATDWPGRPFAAIVLNQLIEHIGNPVEFLARLRSRLIDGGRIYLSTPNLDSAWLRYYGPSWSHWHFPFHQFITGRRGLRKMARRAGYDVKWLRTNSPVHWAYMSDQLAVRGLGGYVSHVLNEPDGELWQRAHGATLVSWLLHDWRGRGDCLHACLVKRAV